MGVTPEDKDATRPCHWAGLESAIVVETINGKKVVTVPEVVTEHTNVLTFLGDQEVPDVHVE